jgi:hypothetical protein
MTGACRWASWLVADGTPYRLFQPESLDTGRLGLGQDAYVNDRHGAAFCPVSFVTNRSGCK